MEPNFVSSSSNDLHSDSFMFSFSFEGSLSIRSFESFKDKFSFSLINFISWSFFEESYDNRVRLNYVFVYFGYSYYG